MQAAFSSRVTVARPQVIPRPVSARVPASVCVCSASAATIETAGDEKWNRSYYPTAADTAKANKDWFVIDAAGQPLGRLASLAARFIRGKHSPTYTPSMDMGAMIVVVNAEKVAVSGTKFDDKLYRRHGNGVVGSMKVETFKQLQARYPEKIVEKAVYGMLPKGRLGKKIKLNMKVYKGSEHPHEAQQPVDITNKISTKC